MAFQKLTKIDSLLYFGFIFLLILARNHLIVKVKNTDLERKHLDFTLIEQ